MEILCMLNKKLINYILTVLTIVFVCSELALAAELPEARTENTSSSTSSPPSSSSASSANASVAVVSAAPPPTALATEVPMEELSPTPLISDIQKGIYSRLNNYPELIRYLLNNVVKKVEDFETSSAELKGKQEWFLKTMGLYPDVAQAFQRFLSTDPVSKFKKDLQLLSRVTPRLAISSSASLSSSSGTLMETKSGRAAVATSLPTWSPPFASELAIGAGDPPFFRIITAEGDEFYILGSPHDIQSKRLFGSKTLEEIARLSGQGATLYTEHDLSNAEAVKHWHHLQEAGGIDPSQRCYDRAEEELKGYGAIKLRSSETNVSDLTLSNAVNADPCLGALLLTTHASILKYQARSGTEHELEHQLKWREVRRLEPLSDVFKIQLGHATEEMEFNQIWAKKSLQTIIAFESRSEVLSRLLASEHAIWESSYLIKGNYKWDAILRGSRPHASVGDRNELWVKTLRAYFDNDKRSASGAAAAAAVAPPRVLYFIVVGTGHLAGGPGFSFIHRLRSSISSVARLERFTTAGSWITLPLD
jgi:uncharacterized protein YbaP (TraB family)